jgi:hypothetical protein
MRDGLREQLRRRARIDASLAVLRGLDPRIQGRQVQECPTRASGRRHRLNLTQTSVLDTRVNPRIKFGDAYDAARWEHLFVGVALVDP